MNGEGNIRPANVIARSAEPVEAEIDGEVVMMSLRRGKYYGLDAIGTRIWQLLGTPSTVAAICDVLQQEFDVDTETCSRDVVALLEQLAAEGLIEVRDAS
jgi:hypothetical protein